MLGMKRDEVSEVFILPLKWWNFKRRNNARRGLLTSLKYQEDAVKGFQNAKSKVARDMQVPKSFRNSMLERRNKIAKRLIVPVAPEKPRRHQSKTKLPRLRKVSSIERERPRVSSTVRCHLDLTPFLSPYSEATKEPSRSSTNRATKSVHQKATNDEKTPA